MLTSSRAPALRECSCPDFVEAYLWTYCSARSPSWGSTPRPPEEAETAEASFGLEFQLRDFIAQNIGAIDVDGKRLQLYVDPTGRDAIEYPTAVGPIDILAVDDAGAFFVFELKRARSPDHAIGQLTRYMGWVRQTIGKDRAVNGIIVAKEISESLRYAVSVVPNVSLFEYEVEFHLKPAHQLR
jgi:Endonuclease NucS C-terminal domain